MTALASSDDVEARLGRTLTDSEAARVDALLDDASAAVRSYTGQTFAAGEVTARLRVRRGVVRLPQRPVTAVVTVVDTSGNPVDFTWEGDDRVRIAATPMNVWELYLPRLGVPVVDVTYTAGPATVPADVVAVACQVVARALGRSPAEGGMTSETIEGYSYTVGVIGAAGALGLLPDERAVLDRYRRLGATARLA